MCKCALRPTRNSLHNVALRFRSDPSELGDSAMAAVLSMRASSVVAAHHTLPSPRQGTLAVSLRGHFSLGVSHSVTTMSNIRRWERSRSADVRFCHADVDRVLGHDLLAETVTPGDSWCGDELRAVGSPLRSVERHEVDAAKASQSQPSQCCSTRPGSRPGREGARLPP